MALGAVGRAVSTLVEAAVPAGQFALQETLQRHPGTEFEIVRVASGRAEDPMALLWASTVEEASLPDAVARDPTTEEVEVLSELEDEYLFRVEWSPRTRVVAHVLLAESAAVLAAVGKDDAWRFRVLFQRSESVPLPTEFRAKYGVDVEFERIYELSGRGRRGQLGLTEAQYDTILNAHEMGYYAIPRGANLEELARQMDISHQALSERLRRGHETLVASVLWPEIDGCRETTGAANRR